MEKSGFSSDFIDLKYDNDKLSNNDFRIISSYVNENSKQEEFKINDDFSLISSNVSEISTQTQEHNFQDLGFWYNIRKHLTDFKDKIKFNFIKLDRQINFQECEEIQIFSNVFNLKQEEQIILFNEYINLKILWMHYRSNFQPVISNNSAFSSDAGWGCMIRAGQMILAKAFLEIETNPDLFDILLLFSENQVHKKHLINSKYFKNYLSCNDRKNNENDVQNNIKYFNPKKVNKDYVTPPFSIINIINSRKCSKGAGDWFSDHEIIKTLIELNDKYSPIDGLKILHFADGVVNINNIIKNCFTKKSCICKNIRISFDYDRIDEYDVKAIEESSDYIIVDNLPSDYCNCTDGLFLLGIDKIEDIYQESILEYFNIENNLGMIGGRGTKALYFIGTFKNQIIFLDPHFVSDTINFFANSKSEVISSYSPENFMICELDRMTPCLTLGFVCKSIKDFTTVLDKLKYFKNEKIIHVDESLSRNLHK